MRTKESLLCFRISRIDSSTVDGGANNSLRFSDAFTSLFSAIRRLLPEKAEMSATVGSDGGGGMKGRPAEEY